MTQVDWWNTTTNSRGNIWKLRTGGKGSAATLGKAERLGDMSHGFTEPPPPPRSADKDTGPGFQSQGEVGFRSRKVSNGFHLR